MSEHIKLPFLETKLSLLDFKNLKDIGSLKYIFIELLKLEKIKNIIPGLLKTEIDILKKIGVKIITKNKK